MDISFINKETIFKTKYNMTDEHFEKSLRKFKKDIGFLYKEQIIKCFFMNVYSLKELRDFVENVIHIDMGLKMETTKYDCVMDFITSKQKLITENNIKKSNEKDKLNELEIQINKIMEKNNIIKQNELMKQEIYKLKQNEVLLKQNEVMLKQYIQNITNKECKELYDTFIQN